MSKVMPQGTCDLTEYANEFESRRRDLHGPLHDIRKRAFARLTELGFPTTREEEWRFTNIAPITATRFQTAPVKTTADSVRNHALMQMAQNRIVFHNGHYVPELSRMNKAMRGLVVEPVSQALADEHPALVQNIARHAGYENQPFAAMNTAFMNEGALVIAPKGYLAPEPIYVLYFSSGDTMATVTYPRNLFIVEESAHLRIVEAYIGTEELMYFTNSVTEAVIGANGILDHYKLQDESGAAYHIGMLQLSQERDSSASTQVFTFGGAITRNDTGAVLNGPGGNCVMNGLYFLSGKQLVDNHTRIDHAAPHCESHELFKGILDDSARAVFNGRIIVRQAAQRTDSKQTNKTLVLSGQAVINTNPQLEIFADDVKCTHGATVGQLDEDSLFYLRSRGINEMTARGLLTYAFANDVIGRVTVEPLREKLEAKVLDTQHASEQRHRKGTQ